MKTPESPPPARRYTSPTGRIVIPVLFVVLLIVILGRPILISGLNLGDDEPTPQPTSDDGGRDGDRDGGPTRLASPYPKGCLADRSLSGLGLIAAADGGSVDVRSPTGTQSFALRANPPIGWSPSGRYLATAGADLWSTEGGHIGIVFSRPVQTWAWSPISDCMVAVVRNRLVVGRPDQPAELLVRGPRVTTFSFSPDGTRIVFAVDDGDESGIWVADLRTGRLDRLVSSIGWILRGWSPADEPLLERVDEGGAALSFPSGDEISYCGQAPVAIVEGEVTTLGFGRAFSQVPAGAGVIYRGLACSPDGNLIVAVAGRRRAGPTSVNLIQADGSIVEELARDSVAEDHPMWGPSGTGVVFVGTTGGEGAPGPLVWFIPEGGSARLTGLRVGDLSDDLDARLDWSATAPLGHPTN